MAYPSAVKAKPLAELRSATTSRCLAEVSESSQDRQDSREEESESQTRWPHFVPSRLLRDLALGAKMKNAVHAASREDHGMQNSCTKNRSYGSFAERGQGGSLCGLLPVCLGPLLFMYALTSGTAWADESLTVFDPAQCQDLSSLKVSGGKPQWVTGEVSTVVDALPGVEGSGWQAALSSKRVSLLAEPGSSCTLTLAPEEEVWDLTKFTYLVAELRNACTVPVRVELHVRSREPKNQAMTRQWRLQAGEGYLLRLTLRRTVPSHLGDIFFGMRGFPALLDPQRGIDVSQVTHVTIVVRGGTSGATVEVGRIYTTGSAPQPEWIKRKDVSIFPIIDRYGQYIHANWPGKIEAEEDFRRWQAREQEDLALHPGPKDWNRFGGWTKGPRFPATGHFYPIKHEGNWWLVDPEGCLFWSHGVDCVRATTATTPITDRLHYFAELPERQGPFAGFFGRSGWAPHGYYAGKGVYETFCFSGANLLRKYGPQWETIYRPLVHRRLRSWGLNTIGNWSGSEIYQLRQTPYVVNLSSGRRPIEGSTGYWGKFPDPFAPDFITPLRQAMEREKTTSADDPWCLGYFVDNELSWGDELSLAVATLISPADQPAKKVFVDYLREKYQIIDNLNAAWGSSYNSWESLLESTTAPDRTRAREDLGQFYSRIASEYFRRIREVIKTYAPKKLYLGCRFAWVNDRAIRAAAEICDVVSFNRYDIDLVDFRLPPGVDRPVIIGEFHFGALDRGMFHPGLQEVATQAERAEAYCRYVISAVRHPAIVGTHWFQYQDQATTGRGDGENYQIGFVDVCDTPYPEIVAASRFVADRIYWLRATGEEISHR